MLPLTFHLDSAIAILAIALPNLLWLFFPPVGVPSAPEQPAFYHRILSALEWLARLVLLTVPLLYGFDLGARAARLCFVGLFASLALYYAGWLRFFLGGRSYALLWAPLWKIPVPLAVAPVLYFGFLSQVTGSVPVLVGAVLLALGHLPASYFEFLRMSR